jgi:hypothetical protein
MKRTITFDQLFIVAVVLAFLMLITGFALVLPTP